jgi:hypothetical protein
MSLTLHELCEKLKQLDEISVLELLNISSEELIARFQDEIEERYDNLTEQFEDEDDTFVDR